ncbi:MAG: hypothetical protein ACRC1K_16420 [Planctomycetia bacterium]
MFDKFLELPLVPVGRTVVALAAVEWIEPNGASNARLHLASGAKVDVKMTFDDLIALLRARTGGPGSE